MFKSKLRTEVCLFLILYLSFHLLFLLKSPIILGGDETFELNIALQKIFALSPFDALEFVQPHHYFSTVLQSISTFPFYIIYGPNEFGTFLGILFIFTCTILLSEKILTERFNAKTSLYFLSLFTFTPLGMLVLSVSSDTTGNVFLAPAALLSFYLLTSNRHSPMQKILFSLLLGLIDLCFVPLFFYMVFTERRFFKIEPFKTRKMAPLLAIGILLQLLMAAKIINKIQEYDLVFSWTGLAWSLETLPQIFLAARTIPPDWLSQIHSLALALFLLILVYSKSVLWRSDRDNKIIVLLSLYFLAYGLLFYFIKSDEPYSKRTLSIAGEYWQPWYYSSLILVSLVAAKDMIVKRMVIVYIFLNLISPIYWIYQGRGLNNSINYNLNFQLRVPRPKIDTIDACEEFIATLAVTETNMRHAKMGCNARETEPRKILETIPPEGIYYYGIGLYGFYLNQSGINFCKLLNQRDAIEKCMAGYHFAKNTMK